MAAIYSVNELLDSMIEERDEKIERLEHLRSKQDLNLMLMQEELHAMRITQREEAYWSRLNKQNQELMSSSAEKRIKELESEIIESAINSSSSVMKLPPTIDKAYVMKIHSHLTKSLRIIGVLDNQITTVKSSCDEVVKSLKAEMADVMEDRSKVEKDLLNQLATLDNEKKTMEDDLRGQLLNLQEKLDQINDSNGNKNDRKVLSKTNENNTNKSNTNYVNNIKEKKDDIEIQSPKPTRRDSKFVPPTTVFEIPLKKQIDSLMTENKALNRTLQESSDKILELQSQKQEQSQTISKIEVDLMAAQRLHAFESAEVIQKLKKDADEAKESISRISEIQAGTNGCIRTLEPQIDFVKLCRNVEAKDMEGRDTLITSLSHALLVQEQIQISLYLVELKLKNQLTSIVDGKVAPEFAKRTMLTRRDATKEKTRQLQNNAILMIRDIEESSKTKIRVLQKEKEVEMDRLKRDLAVSKSTISDLEGIMTQMKQDHVSKATTPIKKSGLKMIGSKSPSVDPEMVDQLQGEVFKAVDRLKEKNDVIRKMTKTIEEHQLREDLLRRQMSRMNKKMTLVEGNDILDSLEQTAWGKRES